MPSMIERLIGDPVLRQDDERIVPIRRPLPERPRDLMDVFSALGGEASTQGLWRGMDLAEATPGGLIFVALNRWPTIDELQAMPGNYNPQRHLSALVHGVEYRRLLIQRVLSAFPEKRRMLYVRIPRCAGTHFLALVRNIHPLFPDAIASARPALPADYLRTLGAFLKHVVSQRSIMVMQPRLRPFYRVEQPPEAADGEGAASGLPWTMLAPPYRAEDRLFTIVRDPAEIILSQANAIADALRWPAEQEAPATRRWRHRLGTLPDAADTQAWAVVVRTVLARFPDRDPICHALGDGTLHGALEACALTNIEIADVSRFGEWIVRAWETKYLPPEPTLPPALVKAALTAEDRDRLAALTEQDRPLYARIKAAITAAELSSIKGLQLAT